MRRIIEYCLLSIDGVFASPRNVEFFPYRNDAYMRDGLGQLETCGAMLMGKNTYEGFANLWPGRAHPWAARINGIKKYVFSSTLKQVDWSNSVLVRGDVPTEVRRLKEEDGPDLLIYGHGLLGQTLLHHNLIDAIDVSIHPLILGSGGLFFRENETATLKLTATKTFGNIVKLTYEPEAAG